MTIMADLALEVAFSTGAAETGWLYLDDPVRGKLDTGKLGPDSFFVDVSADLVAATISRGVARFDGVYGRAEAGRASAVLRNESRDYDPSNLSGPYVAAGVTQVVPMRLFRFRATWAGVVYDLFRGYADEWRLAYPGPYVATTELIGTDGTKVLANYDGLAGASVGAGENSGARIGRLLDNTAWPATDRDLDTGLTTVQATTLADNTWEEMGRTSDTEIGELYLDGAGKVVYRNRRALFTDTRSSTSQATFGTSGAELRYRDVEMDYSDASIRNVVRIARVGGTTQVAQDAASKTKYLPRTWGRTDLIMETDTEAADYAGYVLFLSKDAELRFTSLTVDPTADPAGLWPQVLGRELGDRITVVFRPPGGGTITRDCFIRGISHDTGPDHWITTWALQDATRFAFLVLDHATLGKLDSNALAY